MPTTQSVLPHEPVTDVPRWAESTAGTAAPREYWCARSLVVEIRRGSDPPVVQTIDQPFAVVGSEPDVTVYVADPQMARRHFYLHAMDDGVYCLDLTPSEGEHDTGGRWLPPGEVLRIGDVQLQVRLKEGQAVASAERNPIDLSKRDSVVSGRPIVQVSRDGKPLVNRTISRHLTLVGRNPPSSFRIESRSVSSVHCALFWHRQQLWVIDLASASGTTWRDRPRDATSLASGDFVRVGNYTLKLVSGAADTVATGHGHAANPADWSTPPGSGIHDFSWQQLAASTLLDSPERPPWTNADFTASRAEASVDEARRRWEEETARLASLRDQLGNELAEAGAARRHWEDEQAKLITTRAALEKELADNSAARAKWEAESKQLAEARQQLNTEIAHLSQARERWRREADEPTADRDRLKQELAAAESARLHWESQAAEVATLRQQLREAQERAASAEQANAESAAANADASSESAANGGKDAASRAARHSSPQILQLRKELERERSAVAFARKKLETETERLEESRRQLDAETAHWSEARRVVEAEGEQLAFAFEQLKLDRVEVEVARKDLVAKVAEVTALRAQLQSEIASVRQGHLPRQRDDAHSGSSLLSLDPLSLRQDSVPVQADDESQPVISRQSIETKLGDTSETYDPHEATLPVGAMTSQRLKEMLAQAAAADWQVNGPKSGGLAPPAAGSMLTISRRQAVAAVIAVIISFTLVGLIFGAWLMAWMKHAP